jgi:hypothetical protein
MAHTRLAAALAASLLIFATLLLPASAQTDVPIIGPPAPTPTITPTPIPSTEDCSPDRISHDGLTVTSHLQCPDGTTRKLVTYYADGGVQFQYIEYHAATGELSLVQWTRYDPGATPQTQLLASSDAS